MSALSFTIPCAPHGKGRPRFSRVGRFTRVYTDAVTVAYERAVAIYAKQAHGGQVPLVGPLAASIQFVMPRPKRTPLGLKYHATKPDLDNLVKAICDGITQAGCWGDDAQVAVLSVTKTYGDEPRCDVAIVTLEATS